MPIYEYRCQDCSSEFEYMQRMSDAAKSECESCGGTLERLISRSAFHLKGSGWYKDLYSSPKPGASSGSSDSGSSSSSGSTGKSSDSSSGTSKDSGGASATKSSGGSSGSSASTAAS